MGVQTTTYMPGDLHRKWKETGDVTADGRPVPLSRLLELGLEAWYDGHMVPRPPDAIDALARLLRDGLVELGLLNVPGS